MASARRSAVQSRPRSSSRIPKSGGHPGLLRVLATHPGAQGVDGADLGGLELRQEVFPGRPALPDPLADAASQLLCGLLGEGDGHHLQGREPSSERWCR